MNFLPEKLDADFARNIRNSIILALKTAITAVSVDSRDQWPIHCSCYLKGDVLSRGDFCTVKVADCRDPVFGFSGNETRRCVVKTVYFRRRIETLLVEKFQQRNNSLVTVDEKVYCFWKRTIMDIYILTRCRHENLMHAHALFVADDDLHIIFPRCYALSDLIEMYRVRHDCEPCPVAIIARIIRQICIGLEFLNSVGIAHRDVQPDNIYLTRNGTIKLGHFGQARSIVGNKRCVTPVGKMEFMAFEKQHNFYVDSRDDCVPYSSAADIWSIGVLVLQMISYFPHEPYQKLPTNFATLMQKEKLPFNWLIANMMQLRSRIVKSGGEELKTFLSDRLLTAEDEKRGTPKEILASYEIHRWCSSNVEDDKRFLRKKFIDDVDFANQFKLESDGPNYDHLESKNIPAEFYWDDSWKKLDEQDFVLTVNFEGEEIIRGSFTWGKPSPFFALFYPAIENGHFDLADLFLLETGIDKLAFEIIHKGKNKNKICGKNESQIILPPRIGENIPREVLAVLEVPIKKKKDSIGWSTDEEDPN